MVEDPGVVQQFRDHRVTFTATTVVKEATAASYAARLDDERAWYRYVHSRGFTHAPRVITWDPFAVERVNGVPLHHLTGLSTTDRRSVFAIVSESVVQLHSLEDRPASRSSQEAAYSEASAHAARLVAEALGSGWPRPRTVNEKAVDDLDFHVVRDRAQELGAAVEAPPRFVPVHGELSLSNLLWDRSRQRLFVISPRGRFGGNAIFGDPLVDWARLYFAVTQNADALVEGAYRLDRDANSAQVRIGSTGWESFAGHVRATVLDRWEDLERLQPLFWLGVAGSLLQRPSQLEAAYLLALHAFAALDE